MTTDHHTTMADEPSAHRPASSIGRPAVTFKVRSRALSPGRQRDVDTWMRRWGLAETGGVLDLGIVFGGEIDVVLDIGFGHGESTLALAETADGERPGERPGDRHGVIGVEIHTPGVATALEQIAARELDDVRIVHGDALVLLDRVPLDSLAGVCIYFPDPWPKSRHHHRRLVDGDVIGQLTDRLVVGGSLHLATDNDAYTDAMELSCGQERRLAGGPVDRPAWRPITRFERRALDEGRRIVDLVYHRTR